MGRWGVGRVAEEVESDWTDEFEGDGGREEPSPTSAEGEWL